jgi:hypothetical protein
MEEPREETNARTALALRILDRQDNAGNRRDDEVADTILQFGEIIEVLQNEDDVRQALCRTFHPDIIERFVMAHLVSTNGGRGPPRRISDKTAAFLLLISVVSCRVTDLDQAALWNGEPTICGDARRRVTKALAAKVKSLFPPLDGAADVKGFVSAPDAVAAIDLAVIETVSPESLVMSRSLFSKQNNCPCVKLVYAVLANGLAIPLSVSPGRMSDREVLARSSLSSVGLYLSPVTTAPNMQTVMGKTYYKFLVPAKIAPALRLWLPSSYYELSDQEVDLSTLQGNDALRADLAILGSVREKLRECDIFRKIPRGALNGGMLGELLTIGFAFVNYAQEQRGLIVKVPAPGYVRRVPPAVPVGAPERYVTVGSVPPPKQDIGVMEKFQFSNVLEWSRGTMVPASYPHDDGSVEVVEIQPRRVRATRYFRPRTGARRPRQHTEEGPADPVVSE